MQDRIYRMVEIVLHRTAGPYRGHNRSITTKQRDIRFILRS